MHQSQQLYARARARRVRLSLECETGQQTLQQQVANEARVREIEEGWCDSNGSVEKIQAKLVKRQEAAAKRERAMDYGLTHQWQAGTRQLSAHSGFQPDKNNWGWNWLERWMAVRPWENRFLDSSNLRERGCKLKQYGAARARARRVRLSLECETGQQTLQQQVADEARVREIEEGWCDSNGSVEQIQAKLVKRQEAAAKRERAMDYGLTHQWQAGTRQLSAHSGFQPDKNNWGWNWLERWMAVRPWENRFLDSRCQTLQLLYPSGKAAGPSLSDNDSSSPGSIPVVSKARSKLAKDDLAVEVNSRRPGAAPRSHSSPKERLSLPNSGQISFSLSRKLIF
ncbi:hypothetical protein F2Q70_00010289 [Brassica cretica]|uniref:DUF4005 domain-containing protein n=1 Tax=Brassica cretica TaxID=69181 RepID=A0A8S9LY66_BRACR|nr:hypothetical protein F2Q70_00010289 [Brassica cretica]